MAPVPTPYEKPWEEDCWQYPRPGLDEMGQFFLYPSKTPGSFSEKDLTTDQDFTPPHLDQQYIVVIEDVELGYRDNMTWDVPKRTSHGYAIKDPNSNRTMLVKKTGKFPVQLGWTVIDTRDIIKEVRKTTKSGLKAKKPNTPPGRFGKRWLELGIVRVYNVVIKEYMTDYHPGRRLSGWRRNIAPNMGAYVKTNQVALKDVNNHLEGFWSGLEQRNLTEEEKAVGYKRKIVMGAWAWDLERRVDVSIGKCSWSRAFAFVDIQKWEAYTRREDHKNNGKSLSFVCDKLGIPHHDNDDQDLCHAASNDSFLTMLCVLATLFKSIDAYGMWKQDVNLIGRKPPK